MWWRPVRLTCSRKFTVARAPDKTHVCCPQANSTQTHRKRLHKWWASKEWKEYVRVNTEGKRCQECGCSKGQIKGDRKPAILTVNHLYRELYNSFEEYLKFTEGKTEVTCTTCNWMFEKGMNICPVCLSNTVAKYKHWREPMCRSCFKRAHPEIEAAKQKRDNEMKALKKKLREDEKARVRQWKIDHPTVRTTSLRTPRSRE